MSEQQFQNVDEYIAYLQEHLAQAPECGNTHYNLGVAYLSKHEYVTAEKYFRSAVANSPKMAEGYV